MAQACCDFAGPEIVEARVVVTGHVSGLIGTELSVVKATAEYCCWRNKGSRRSVDATRRGSRRDKSIEEEEEQETRNTTKMGSSSSISIETYLAWYTMGREEENRSEKGKLLTYLCYYTLELLDPRVWFEEFLCISQLLQITCERSRP